MLVPGANLMKHFTAVITPLAAYFSKNLTQLRRERHNYGRKKFYYIGHWFLHFILVVKYGNLDNRWNFTHSTKLEIFFGHF
jgi:hypothetical protein